MEGKDVKPAHWNFTITDPNGNKYTFLGVSYHAGNELISLDGNLYDSFGYNCDIEKTIPELRMWLNEMYNNLNNSK